MQAFSFSALCRTCAIGIPITTPNTLQAICSGIAAHHLFAVSPNAFEFPSACLLEIQQVRPALFTCCADALSVGCVAPSSRRPLAGLADQGVP